MKLLPCVCVLAAVAVVSEQAYAGFNGTPNGMGGSANGFNGTSNGMGGSANGMGGSANGFNGTMNGMGGTPNGYNGTPNGMGGTSNGWGSAGNGNWINMGGNIWVTRPNAIGDANGLIWVFTTHGRKVLNDLRANGQLVHIFQTTPLFSDEYVHNAFVSGGLTAFQYDRRLNETLFEDGLTAMALHYFASAGLNGSFTITSLKDSGQSYTLNGNLGLADDFLRGNATLDDRTARLLMGFIAASTNEQANVLLSQRTGFNDYGFSPFDAPDWKTGNKGRSNISGLPQAKGTKALVRSARFYCNSTDGAVGENCGFDPNRSIVFRVNKATTITVAGGTPKSPSKTARARICFGANLCDAGAQVSRGESLIGASAAFALNPGLHTIAWSSGILKISANADISFGEGSLFPLLEATYMDDSKNGILAASAWGMTFADVAPIEVQTCQARYSRTQKDDTGIDFFDRAGNVCDPSAVASYGLSMFLSNSYGSTRQQFYTDRACARDVATGKTLGCRFDLATKGAEDSCDPAYAQYAGFPYITWCNGNSGTQPSISSYVSDWCDNVIVGSYTEATDKGFNQQSLAAGYCTADKLQPGNFTMTLLK